jgi:4-amino-4-deoxy-L-arabinose transferase-like glycosyltransferase
VGFNLDCNLKSAICNLKFPMTMRTRTDALLLAGFCAFLFLYGLGQFGLIGADEPRYAQVAREMLERHDWITPTLGGQPWLEKPPLYYWQAMLVYSVLGSSDVAARIPSGIDATLLIVATYLFFRRLRPGVEVDAALISASCAGIVGYARAASMDMALVAAFGIAMLAWWTWCESDQRIYLALFYLSIALGMLAKGPVAPVLATIVILGYSAASGEWGLVLRTLWIPGIMLFCLLGLPWYVAVQLRNPSFFREFILEHNLARFSTNLYHHPQPFWYYLPVMLLALVPWTVFVAAAFVEQLRFWWAGRKSTSTNPDLEFQFGLFICCWLAVPVVFFSISQSKLPGYVLPAVPAAAALLAQYLRQHLEKTESAQPRPTAKWLAVSHALVAAAPIVPAMLVGFLVMQHHLPGGRARVVAVATAIILSLAIALTLISRHGLRMLRFVTLIPVVLSVAAVLKLGATAIDEELSARPLAMELAEVETHRLPVAVYGGHRELEYGLAFYRNQVIERYEYGQIPAGEHLLVAPTSWMDQVAKATAGRRVTFLGHYAPQNLDYYWVSSAVAKN